MKTINIYWPVVLYFDIFYEKSISWFVLTNDWIKWIIIGNPLNNDLKQGDWFIYSEPIQLKWNGLNWDENKFPEF